MAPATKPACADWNVAYPSAKGEADTSSSQGTSTTNSSCTVDCPVKDWGRSARSGANQHPRPVPAPGHTKIRRRSGGREPPRSGRTRCPDRRPSLYQRNGTSLHTASQPCRATLVHRLPPDDEMTLRAGATAQGIQPGTRIPATERARSCDNARTNRSPHHSRRSRHRHRAWLRHRSESPRDQA